MRVPAGPPDELDILESLMASLAGTDPGQLPDEEKARRLRALERVDAMGAAVAGGSWRLSTPRTGT